MPSIRAINLASVMPDLADLPGNRALLTAFLAGNGLLANISDLNDAEDIKNQTAGLMSTPDEAIYAEQGLPLGLTHQINKVTGYRRQANRVIYPVYPVGVPPLIGDWCPRLIYDERVVTFLSTCRGLVRSTH